MSRPYSEGNDAGGDADKHNDERDDMPERDPDDERDDEYDCDLIQAAAANARSALFQQVSQIARDAVALAQATKTDN